MHYVIQLQRISEVSMPTFIRNKLAKLADSYLNWQIWDQCPESSPVLAINLPDPWFVSDFVRTYLGIIQCYLGLITLNILI